MILFSCFAFAFQSSVVGVEAKNLQDAFKSGAANPLDSAAIPAGYDTSNADTKFNTVFSIIIRTILSLLGIVFLVLMIYGGFLWMTARGNESQVTKARDLLTAAMIGLGIVIGAYAITYFILSKVSENILVK